MSGYTYFFSKSTIQGLKDLGFPDFFRVQLGIMQLIAAVVLLLPNLPFYVKDWTYAGVGFFLITAAVAPIAHNDSFVLLILLGALSIALALFRWSLGVVGN